MFYSREHCNYNHHKAPFDYYHVHHHGNPSMHFPRANHNNAQHHPSDQPTFDNFATFTKKPAKKHKTYRRDFPAFNYYPRNMFSKNFFGPSPIYETFITPESAYLVFQDPNKLTVQFTQVRRAPNGQQQRVTIQQDFNDQDELQKFLVDIEKKLMTKKTGEAAETSKQHTGVVVIEEPDENTSPTSTVNANANPVDADSACEIKKVDNSKDKLKQGVTSSSEASLKPANNTDASNENDSPTKPGRKFRKRSKKRRQRMKKTFYFDELKEDRTRTRPKAEELGAERRSARKQYHRHRRDEPVSGNDNASVSQESSQKITKLFYRNPYASVKDKSLKKNLKKMPKVKRRDIYDGCSNNHVAFGEGTTFNDLYGGWPNNHIAFSEEAIYDKDQFQPPSGYNFSRSKSASAKRNSNYANILDARFQFPSPRFFDQPMQPQVHPLNNASREQWFNFAPHRSNVNNFSHHQIPFGLRYNVPYGNRSFLQQRQF